MQANQGPETLNVAKRIKGDHESVLLQQKDVLSQVDLTTTSTMQELTTALQLHRSRLGMTFVRKGEDELQIVFTLLDPSMHDREFKFNILLTSDDKYRGTGL